MRALVRARARAGVHRWLTVPAGLAPYTAGQDRYSASTAPAGAPMKRPEIAPSTATAGTDAITSPVTGALLLLPLTTGTHVVVADSTHGACAAPRTLSSATVTSRAGYRKGSRKPC